MWLKIPYDGSSHLHEHCQCLKYNSVLSDYEQISYGVPQWSVLKPTLYIVHVNDLLYSLLDGSVMVYADNIPLPACCNT
jgi:hypothetical protein